MVEPCIQAIDLANEGQWEATIPMPEGVRYQGQDEAPVHAIVEQHHLEFWIIESELEAE